MLAETKPKRRVSQAPVKFTVCHAGCGRAVEYRTNPRVVCAECRPDKHRDRSRKSMERQRRKRGISVVKGTSIHCTRCGVAVVREGRRRKYCEPCRLVVDTERTRAYSASRSADPRRREGYNSWLREKRRADPKWALNKRIATYMAKSLRGRKDGRKWQELVGYTVDDLMLHLERQFLSGMTWSNRDKWHVDHIVPLASFEFTAPEDDGFKAAWALTNLRPLWSEANVRKGGNRQHLI